MFFPGPVRGVELIPPEAKHEQNDAHEIDYRFLAENCADILCSVGADHVIHYASPSSLRILGWKPEAMMGKDFGDFVFPEDISVLDEAGAVDVKGGPADSQATVRLLKKDLTPIWTSISARSSDGQSTGIRSGHAGHYRAQGSGGKAVGSGHDRQSDRALESARF
jgi:PAS domain S-box-containing protein